MASHLKQAFELNLAARPSAEKLKKTIKLYPVLRKGKCIDWY